MRKILEAASGCEANGVVVVWCGAQWLAGTPVSSWIPQAERAKNERELFFSYPVAVSGKPRVSQSLISKVLNSRKCRNLAIFPNKARTAVDLSPPMTEMVVRTIVKDKTDKHILFFVFIRWGILSEKREV